MSVLETVGFARQEFTKRPCVSLSSLSYSGDNWDSNTHVVDVEGSTSLSAGYIAALVEAHQRSPRKCSPVTPSQDGERTSVKLESNQSWTILGSWNQDTGIRHDIHITSGSHVMDNREAYLIVNLYTALWQSGQVAEEIATRGTLDWSAATLMDSMPEIVSQLDQYTARANAVEYFGVIVHLLQESGFEYGAPYQDVFGCWITDYFREEDRITCAVSASRVQVLSYLSESIGDQRFDLESASKRRLIVYLEGLLGEPE